MNKLQFSKDGGKTLFSEFATNLYDFSKAKIDIIVPFRNCYQIVIDLVDSLLTTSGCSYLITLVDDGSDNGSFGTNLSRKKPVRVIRNQTSLGFGESINVGIRSTQNPYVAVLHSDCKIVQSSWLSTLGSYLLEHKESGTKLVHPRTNEPTIENHPQLPSTNLENRMGGGVATEPLPLICFLCNRMLFEKIGGFKSYYPAGYENYEFFTRMMKAKYKQSVCLDSYVFHHGSKTISTLNKKEAAMIEDNYDKFLTDSKMKIIC